jgi:hypothetical protein
LSAIALAVSGCGTSYVATTPRPSEALMVDCPDPQLIPDINNQSIEQINIERIEVAKYAICNRDRFHGLRDFLRGLK